MRAIIINPNEYDVQEMYINANLETLQSLVKGYIEVAAYLEYGDVLFVNEEGLYQFNYFFDIGAHQPFCGPGVIVGEEDSTGKFQDAVASINHIKSIIKFGIIRKTGW